MENIDASLTRLGTDYVDLYQIHRFDPSTPIVETMEALHDVVKAGKARYIGASSMWTWQFAKMQHAADLNGWTRFVSMQDQYYLLYREEEREMFGLLADQGVGRSPTARSRRAASPSVGDITAAQRNDPVQARFFVDADEPIVQRHSTGRRSRGVPMAQVALAWVLRNPVVSAPIIGATRAQHLDDAVAALDLDLTDAEVDRPRGALHAPPAHRLLSGSGRPASASRMPRGSGRSTRWRGARRLRLAGCPSARRGGRRCRSRWGSIGAVGVAQGGSHGSETTRVSDAMLAGGP